MPEQIDLYKFDSKIVRALQRIKKDRSIRPSNQKKIIQFQKFLSAEGIGSARILKYIYDLPKIEALLKKNFEKATRKDFERILNELQSQGYSQNTMIDYKKTIKKFYKWLNNGVEPDSIKWIKTGRKPNNNKIAEDLLTEEEIKSMIQTALNPRDRAIISVLWESGCRAGELLGMQVKHVVFEKALSRIVINGKTGMRRVPLIDSTPYIADWLDHHSQSEDQNAPLWIGIGAVGRDKSLNYAALRKMLMQVKQKANIKKNVNPHNFRHSRATILAKHLTEAELNQYLGWVQGSNIPAVYVHLSGRDMDDAILKIRGIEKKEEKQESTLAPKQCFRCKSTNKATSDLCINCGAALNIESAYRMKERITGVNDKIDILIKDPEFLEYLIKKMKELEL